MVASYQFQGVNVVPVHCGPLAARGVGDDFRKINGELGNRLVRSCGLDNCFQMLPALRRQITFQARSVTSAAGTVKNETVCDVVRSIVSIPNTVAGRN